MQGCWSLTWWAPEEEKLNVEEELKVGSSSWASSPFSDCGSALSFFGDEELNRSINTFLALVAYASQQLYHSHTKKIMPNFCRRLRSSCWTTSQFPGPNDLRTECFNAHNTTAYSEMWSKARRSHNKPLNAFCYSCSACFMSLSKIQKVDFCSCFSTFRKAQICDLDILCQGMQFGTLVAKQQNSHKSIVRIALP
jgi:hypothetical protein